MKIIEEKAAEIAGPNSSDEGFVLFDLFLFYLIIYQ